MRLFEKIKLHTMDSTKSRVILVLGKPLVYYQREHFLNLLLLHGICQSKIPLFPFFI